MECILFYSIPFHFIIIIFLKTKHEKKKRTWDKYISTHILKTQEKYSSPINIKKIQGIYLSTINK